MLLLEIIQVLLIVLLMYLLISWTLRRINQASTDLEQIGQPFTLWNWLNLDALKQRHRQQNLVTARDYLESLADVSRAKELVRAEIETEMRSGLTFEAAARKVILGEANHEREDDDPGGRDGNRLALERGRS